MLKNGFKKNLLPKMFQVTMKVKEKNNARLILQTTMMTGTALLMKDTLCMDLYYIQLLLYISVVI